MRPVIGVTSYVEPAHWAVWADKRAALLPQAYVDHLRAAGARVVVLPPDDADPDILDRLDGLVLAGGADVGPDNYGAQPHERTVTRPDRDAGELLLARAALARDLPVLGICRGMQVLAVASGGALHQHLPDLVGHSEHQPAPGVHADQTISTVPGSRLAGIIGEHSTVRCYHHQSVADPGSLVPSAYAEGDVIEAVEDPTRTFVVGVQWHPEEGVDPRLFDALVAAARARD